MKADYERQTIALTDVLARLNAERAELANGVKSEHPALVAFTKHQNIDQLSRELLVELIDHIKFVTMPPVAAQMMMKAVDFLLLVPYPSDLLYPYSGDTSTLQSTL